MIDKLQQLPIEVVDRFLAIRDHRKAGIPEALAAYILQVNAAHNLYARYRSVTECAQHLRLSYPSLSLPTCKARVYDAINFFNSDCTVTAAAWDNYFADQLMKVAEVALIAHKFSEVRRCFDLANTYRRRASENAIDPRRIEFKPQIVSADMKLQRMGVTDPKGILAAYSEAKKIIASRDISPTEKDRLLSELQAELDIDDTDHEEEEV